MSNSKNLIRGQSELPTQWGSAFLKFCGWFTVIVAIILGIILITLTRDGYSGFWEEHPFAITGIIVGLTGIIQGLIMLGIANYMEVQRHSFHSLQRTLRDMDKELSKASKMLSGMDKELSKAFQSLTERLDS
tara:strand:- start:194 stop:589 length:396 start_codon:yes stop_codon:yes gene_type:complete